MSDLDDVHPLPGGVPIRHVYRAERLGALLEDDLSFREAFLTWATEATAIYDQAAALGGVERMDDVRARAVLVWQEHTKADERWRARREAIQPLIDARMTMRQIANYLAVPLLDVVQVHFSQSIEQGGRKAEQYALLEEHLVERGADQSLRSLCGLYGVGGARGGGGTAISTLLQKHGIPVPARNLSRQKYPTQWVVDMYEAGASWQEIAARVVRKYPHLKGEFTPKKAKEIGHRARFYRKRKAQREHAPESRETVTV